MSSRSDGSGVKLEFPPLTKSLTYQGRTFTFRELTVGENDVAREAATDGDNFDGRKMMRMMVVMSSVDPEISDTDLPNIPQRLYTKIVDLVNELHDPDSLDKKDDEPGNA